MEGANSRRSPSLASGWKANQRSDRSLAQIRLPTRVRGLQILKAFHWIDETAGALKYQPLQLSFPLLSCYSREGARKATRFCPCSAGEVAGFLILRSSLRQRVAGGETPVLVRLVDRGRSRIVGGAAVVGGSASGRIKCAAACPPSRLRLRRSRKAAGAVCSQIDGSGERGCRCHGGRGGCAGHGVDFCPPTLTPLCRCSLRRVGGRLVRGVQEMFKVMVLLPSSSAARKMHGGVWSLLPAHSSCVRWLTATISPAVGAWCGGKLEVVVPESPLNKLALR